MDGTHKMNSGSMHVPKAYRKKGVSPGRLLDMMEEVNHKGPISHKIVSEAQFEKLAAKTVAKDGGKPMIEKTIFIVKPVYVPIEVPVPASTKSDAPLLSGKKGMKLKKKV